MIKFGKRDKKKKLSDFDKRQMLKHGQLPDESDWDWQDVKFIKDVRTFDPDGHTVLQILQVDPLDRLDFIDDLEADLARKKERAELGLDKADTQAAEIERKRAEAAAAAQERIDETKRQADAERHERAVQAAAEATAETARKEQEATDKRRSLLRKKVHYKHKKEALMSDRAARIQRSEQNLKIVLDWLRQEPYSTIEVMAQVLRMSASGARKTLVKIHAKDWLVRDEVEKWPGVPGVMHLYGISSSGLYHLLDEGDVEPPPDRDFKRKKTRPSNSHHVLNIQLARLYHQRINNPDHNFRLYTAARDLPNYGEKHYRWETYPDAVFRDSHLFYDHNKNRGLTVAVEIEQHGKGTKRYKHLIQAHIQNMESRDYIDEDFSDRYDLVIYYLPNANVAAVRKRLFHKLIDQRYGDKDVAASHKNRFQFDTYDDLAERIETLG